MPDPSAQPSNNGPDFDKMMRRGAIGIALSVAGMVFGIGVLVWLVLR